MRRIRLSVASLLAILASHAALAHEATLRVTTVRIERGHFVVTVPIDPVSALNRIELAKGDELTEPRDPRAALEARESDVRNAFLLIFRTHSREVRTLPQVSVSAGSIQLRGAVPEHATHFRFGNALASGDSVVHLEDGSLDSRTPLHADEMSAAIPLAVRASTASTLGEYLRLGVLHIIPRGLDHILFILALFFLSPKLRTLLAQVSTFTVAHTVTLGLAMYGVVQLPSRIVEPLIALSIVFAASENLRPRGSGRGRIAVVALFGLLHGLGFASALSETGLPRGERAVALIGFNCGVELAQLLVVAGAAMVVAVSGRWLTDAHRRLAVPASVAIAVTGLWWTVSRLL